MEQLMCCWQEEFAEALGVKSDSDFVMQMFNMVDNNADGYISFKEFLATVVLFSKGTALIVVVSKTINQC